jgi:hypothetical protein
LSERREVMREMARRREKKREIPNPCAIIY